MSYAVEVIADNSGQWAGNACRYPTKEEAEVAAIDLSMRWMLVRDWRVVESDDPANYTIINGRMEPVKGE